MYYIKAEKSRKGKVLAVMLPMLIMLFLAAVDIPLKSIMKESAATQAKIKASEAINDAVLTVLRSRGYSDFVALSMSDDNEVTAITTDAAAVNAFKTEITKAVKEKLGSKDICLSVPLGTLLDMEMLDGRGPDVSVHIRLDGNVTARLKGDFISVGINQTRHRITVDVTAEAAVIMPGCVTHTQVTTEYLAAETVIVGGIPDSYTNVNGDDSGIVGQIFDYADMGE